MPRAHRWRDLKVGLWVLGATITAAALILVFARVGALHGRTMRVYAVTPSAEGVLPGTEVWLAGQKVGLVKAVGFRPPATDTALRVLLTLEVLDQYRPQIGRNARVSVRPGTSFIGSPVVAIAEVRTVGHPVADGDTLFANPEDSFDALRTRVMMTGNQLPVILDNLRVLALQLRTAQGTLGALGIHGPEQLEATGRAFGSLADRAAALPAAVGARAGTLPARARDILARVDAIRARLGDPALSVGRYRNDSTLVLSIDSLRADVADVQRLLDQPVGTAGRARADAALRIQLARARAELDALAADVRRNPLRYLGF